MKHLLILIFLISCTPGNQIRKRVQLRCSDISLPREAILDRSTVKYIPDPHIPVLYYNHLGRHALHLRECAQALDCLVEWTEWERNCEKSKTMIDEILNRSCKIEKPTCEVG
jgi:hypothetical protein